ncbi:MULTISPECIES: DUF4920 domain-containing protein [unclassified Flavobacterium]|uniref:DUF4920 domain-containing protein n=1 Tax=unclassified Flavobacterium TaxID=196869 RepID=UPI0012AA0841|nr:MULTISPECIES: DUF4920 domain-containing protein [unclassified Flavobacterium]MBF4484803.1 DUF4920 domain-containing protein [Flavobacterium sp. CSZ]QGK75649.1 DUF4920 domain-containing protein [Flavobacterium sp. SLB02]
MKRLLYTVVIFISISSQSFSQEAVEKKGPPSGNAVVGDYYGADVSKIAEVKAISVKELEGKLQQEKKAENVTVKGMVTDVCPKKGCWVTLKTEDGTSFFVKMKDYAFFVPTALKGKNVVLEGNAEKEITSVEELKHYAKDAKKAKSEIDAITVPKEEIRFLANGIKVVN